MTFTRLSRGLVCILLLIGFSFGGGGGLMWPHGLVMWEAGIEVLHPKSVFGESLLFSLLRLLDHWASGFMTCIMTTGIKMRGTRQNVKIDTTAT